MELNNVNLKDFGGTVVKVGLPKVIRFKQGSFYNVFNRFEKFLTQQRNEVTSIFSVENEKELNEVTPIISNMSQWVQFLPREYPSERDVDSRAIKLKPEMIVNVRENSKIIYKEVPPVVMEHSENSDVDGQSSIAVPDEQEIKNMVDSQFNLQEMDVNAPMKISEDNFVKKYGEGSAHIDRFSTTDQNDDSAELNFSVNPVEEQALPDLASDVNEDYQQGDSSPIKFSEIGDNFDQSEAQNISPEEVQSIYGESEKQKSVIVSEQGDNSSQDISKFVFDDAISSGLENSVHEENKNLRFDLSDATPKDLEQALEKASNYNDLSDILARTMKLKEENKQLHSTAEQVYAEEKKTNNERDQAVDRLKRFNEEILEANAKISQEISARRHQIERAKTEISEIDGVIDSSSPKLR